MTSPAPRLADGDPAAPTAGKPVPAQLSEHSQIRAAEAVDRLLHAQLGQMTGGFSVIALAQAWQDWAAHLAQSPGRQAELVARAAQEWLHLIHPAFPCPSAETDCNDGYDPRFQGDAWKQWPFSGSVKAFKAAERWWTDAVRGVRGVSRAHEELLAFMVRQALDVAAPSNFPWTNPEVLERIRETGGQCLVDGARIAASDMAHALAGLPPPETAAFRPGDTVAITPGSVVLRTPLCEVIQYAPRTPQVLAEPVVIVPAWINRYYILDLEPETSMVRHLVERGFTVFMISWKNPTAEDRDIGFDDYRQKGILPALEAALAITGAARAHAVGYCLGGTLLAIAAAAMARDGDERLASLSLLAAQVDFSEAGELKLFVNDSQLALLEDMMWRRGVLAGSQMRGTFHLMRSNALIWSRVVRQYLMGEQAETTAMSAWAADSTRMPYRMHSDYLRSLYLNNDLAEGRFRVGDRPVAIQDIRIPIFALGTEWDNVAPWRSVYKLNALADTEVTFVLASRGHNQGVIAPPGVRGRHYRMATRRESDIHRDADGWIAAVPEQQGSWWPAWFDWLEGRSSGRVAAPPMGRPEAGYAVIEPAPGSYVTSP